MEQFKERLEEETTIIDGSVYDAETGEFLHLVERPEFRIEDENSAEWFGEKVSVMDAEMLALDARIRSLTQNLETKKADIKKRRDGMLWKYGPQLEEFARNNLPRGKKTYTNAYISVAFRSIKASVRIRDEDEALKWAEVICPDAIKTTRKVLVTQIPADMKASVLDGTYKTLCLELVPERETVKIDTGVK